MAKDRKFHVPVVVHVDEEAYTAEYGMYEADPEGIREDIEDWLNDLLISKARTFPFITAFKVGQ